MAIPDRSALGCDTATKLTTAQIHTIKNAGYQYVGRYLTNTPGGTLDKCLTVSEIDNILNAGLKLFAIFQESGDAAGKFTRTSGKNDGEKAYVAAREYGFSTSSTIYFAVDFDPTDDIIQSNIIPYFKGILASNARKYRIGVYGTRNVCNKLHDNSREFDSCLHFFTNQIAQNVDYINAFEFFYCQICKNICTNMG